jgi:hypothetical protein
MAGGSSELAVVRFAWCSEFLMERRQWKFTNWHEGCKIYSAAGDGRRGMVQMIVVQTQNGRPGSVQ